MEPTRHDTDSRQLLAERPVSQCTVVTGKVLGIDPDNSAVKLSTVQAYFVYSTYLPLRTRLQLLSALETRELHVHSTVYTTVSTEPSSMQLYRTGLPHAVCRPRPHPSRRPPRVQPQSPHTSLVDARQMALDSATRC